MQYGGRGGSRDGKDGGRSAAVKVQPRSHDRKFLVFPFSLFLAGLFCAIIIGGVPSTFPSCEGHDAHYMARTDFFHTKLLQFS